MPAAKTAKLTQSNFRLSDQARAILSKLAAYYGVSQTAALEIALREHARDKGLKVTT